MFSKISPRFPLMRVSILFFETEITEENGMRVVFMGDRLKVIVEEENGEA